MAKHLSHSFSTSKAEAKGISEVLARMTDLTKKSALSWFYLIMGVIGEYIPDLGKQWAAIKNIADQFKGCVTAFPENAYDASKISNVKSFENKYNSKDEKEKFCMKAKEDVHKFYIAAHDENPDGSAMPTFTGWFKSKAKICEDINKYKVPKLKAKIAKEYGSYQEFYGQCVYFQEVDCDTFEPMTGGLTSFTDKVSKTIQSITVGGECIGKTLMAGTGADMEKVKKVLKGLFGSGIGILQFLLQNALGAVANVVTMGLWGGVKAGYYLIDLGFGIKQVYDKIKGPHDWRDVMWFIGELFGKAIKIVKSLILGRRRRRIR